jgi:hypothetical protein
VSFAVESEGGKHRFWLEDGGPNKVGFVMLNPSLAGAHIDDPTKNKVLQFAKNWMYDGIAIANAYPYRTSYPSALWYDGVSKDDREQWERNRYYLEALASLPLVIVAWGTGCPDDHAKRVTEILLKPGRPLWCLGINKGGSPKHPLYLPYETRLIQYAP